MEAFFAELWCTCLFTLVILCLTDEKTRGTADGGVASWIIAATLGCCLAMAGGISGGSLNPSVGFNLKVWGKIFDNAEDFGDIWIHVGGPFAGGAVAGAFYAFVHKPFSCAAKGEGGGEVHHED